MLDETMARLYQTFVCALALLSCMVQGSQASQDDPRLEMLQREFPLAADAVRNITLRTEECKVQLAAIGSDYIAGLDFATFPLNNVIPSLPDGELRKNLNDLATAISNVSNSLQQQLFGDSERLKEHLADRLDFAHDFVKNVESHFKIDDAFARTQQNKKTSISLFAVYQVKYHALLFEKFNKDLEPEIVSSMTELIKLVRSITIFDDKAKRELRTLLQSLSIVDERSIYKLKNWVEINQDNIEGVAIVNEVAETLSDLCDKGIRASGEKQTALAMKIQLLYMLNTGLRAMQQLTKVQDAVELGRHEFIRSVLFSAIAVGHGFAEDVKATLVLRIVK